VLDSASNLLAEATALEAFDARVAKLRHDASKTDLALQHWDRITRQDDGASIQDSPPAVKFNGWQFS